MPCTWLAVREAMWAMTSFATLTEPSGRSGIVSRLRTTPPVRRPGGRGPGRRPTRAARIVRCERLRRPKTTSTRASGRMKRQVASGVRHLYALHVGARSSVDPDDVAFVDEEGHVEG